MTNARSCHCSRCLKAFSSGSSAFAGFDDASKFRWIEGEDKIQQYESENGWGLGFCSNCGSTLCGLHQGNVIGVTLGTIDGDPGIEIERHIFVGSKAPWDHIGGTAQQFMESGNGA
ncbi:MAG: GFA family protein [Thiohalocapsa sp.]